MPLKAPLKTPLKIIAKRIKKSQSAADGSAVNENVPDAHVDNSVNTISISARADTPSISIALDTLSINKQALVFVSTKRSAEKAAEDIAKHIKGENSANFTASNSSNASTNASTDAWNKLAAEALAALPRPTKQCHRLAFCLKKGIAYHHAGLVHKQRELIEDAFRNGTVRIICATPTLAFGMDLPAFRCVVRDLRRYTVGGMEWLPVLEVQQMFGRAGRPGKEDFGEAVCIASSPVEKQEIFEVYIRGKPEEITSKLAKDSVMRIYTLALIATGFARTQAELLSIFAQSFYAMQSSQAGDKKALEARTLKAIQLLEKWGFIIKIKTDADADENTIVKTAIAKTDERTDEKIDEKVDENRDVRNINKSFADSDFPEIPDFVTANKIYRKKEMIEHARLRAAPLGLRISQLYIDPLAAKHIIDGMTKAAMNAVPNANQFTSASNAIGSSSSAAKISDFGFIHLICSSSAMDLSRPRQSDIEVIDELIIKYDSSFLVNEPHPYAHEHELFMAAVKTSAMFLDWISEKDEEDILDRHNVRPGEFHSMKTILDWLMYCAVELAKIRSQPRLAECASRLRIRLQYGAKEELLPLLKFKDIGRVRARMLYNAGVRSIKDVKSASLGLLAGIVGPSIAKSLKEQVGMENKEQMELNEKT